MIRTILLDIDDTILDFKSCEREALSKALAEFGFSCDDSMIFAYSEINDSMWKMLERGEITRDRLRTERFSRFFETYSINLDANRFADEYMQALSKTSVYLPGAKNAMDELYDSYDLYAVTNGYSFTQKGRISASGLDRYFKKVFISQEVGAVKPEREFFEKCAKEIADFKADETILVGDSLTSDIKGGAAFGLKTVWIGKEGRRFTHDVTPDYTIGSLSELPRLIKNI